MARFTAALVAAVALSLAATAQAQYYTAGVKPTAKPAPKYTPLTPVCQTVTTKCCWDPSVCGVVYKYTDGTVKATCTRQVKVQVPCYSYRAAAVPVGADSGEAAPASARLFDRCYVTKAQKFGCTKKTTVKTAYPKICYKKSCVTKAVPAKFSPPTSAVLTAKATAVPAAVPAKQNPAAVQALFGQLVAALVAKAKY